MITDIYTFKSRSPSLFDNENSVCYDITSKKKNNVGCIVGVVDNVICESANDYIEAIKIFSCSKRGGKSARRWLNRILRPYFEHYGFDPNDLYAGKIKYGELLERAE